MSDRDYDRMVKRSRAALIMAAVERRTVEYGVLSPYAHLAWFSKRVLDPVSEECKRLGEPDLTELVVHKGKPPENPTNAERVYEYWAVE